MTLSQTLRKALRKVNVKSRRPPTDDELARAWFAYRIAVRHHRYMRLHFAQKYWEWLQRYKASLQRVGTFLLRPENRSVAWAIQRGAFVHINRKNEVIISDLCTYKPVTLNVESHEWFYMSKKWQWYRDAWINSLGLNG